MLGNKPERYTNNSLRQVRHKRHSGLGESAERPGMVVNAKEGGAIFGRKGNLMVYSDEIFYCSSFSHLSLKKASFKEDKSIIPRVSYCLTFNIASSLVQM
jgi:hypothetical protein